MSVIVGVFLWTSVPVWDYVDLISTKSSIVKHCETVHFVSLDTDYRSALLVSLRRWWSYVVAGGRPQPPQSVAGLMLDCTRRYWQLWTSWKRAYDPILFISISLEGLFQFVWGVWAENQISLTLSLLESWSLCPGVSQSWRASSGGKQLGACCTSSSSSCEAITDLFTHPLLQCSIHCDAFEALWFCKCLHKALHDDNTRPLHIYRCGNENASNCKASWG